MNRDQISNIVERVLNQNHVNVVVMTMTGNIYRRRKEFDRAMDNYEKALELEPDNNFALFGMGDCYRGKQDMESAVEWWDKKWIQNNITQKIQSAQSTTGKD